MHIGYILDANFSEDCRVVNRKHNDVYHHGLGQRFSKKELEAVHARSADQNAEISTDPFHLLVNGYFASGYFEGFGWLE